MKTLDSGLYIFTLTPDSQQESADGAIGKSAKGAKCVAFLCPLIFEDAIPPVVLREMRDSGPLAPAFILAKSIPCRIVGHHAAALDLINRLAAKADVSSQARLRQSHFPSQRNEAVSDGRSVPRFGFLGHLNYQIVYRKNRERDTEVAATVPQPIVLKAVLPS